MTVPFVRGWLGGILLAILCLLALAFAGRPTANAQPYESETLPQGVLSVNLGGLNINLQTTPTITESQPIISGQLSQSGGTVSINIQSTPQTFSANVGSNGAFNARVPEPLEDGQHSLYFNGALVGQFIVAAADGGSPGPTPRPPDTGSSGVLGGAGGGTSASLVLAGIGGLLVAGGAFVAQQLGRRRPDNQ